MRNISKLYKYKPHFAWPWLRNNPHISYAKICFVPLDDDECLKTPPVCDVNANCKNTLGSYLCSCIEGFTGDGKTCQGKILKKIVLQFFAYLGHSQIRIRIRRFCI